MTREPVPRTRTWSRTISSVRLNNFTPQLHFIFTQFFPIVLSSPCLWKCHHRCSSLSPREIKALFQQSCSYFWVLHRQPFLPKGIWQLYRFRAARQLPILPWNSALSLYCSIPLADSEQFDSGRGCHTQLLFLKSHPLLLRVCRIYGLRIEEGYDR